MSKSTLLHPQFVHTLVPGFHTHLTIPVDFFSKYVEGKSSEKTTAELKSDTSAIRWKVKMTRRRLTSGWEEFAVANNFKIGEVVLVRYEGNLVFHVSDLGSSCCEIRDLPPPRNNNVGDNDIGKNLLKKRLHPRTQEDLPLNDGDGGDDDDDDNDNDMEYPRKKKVKKNSPEAEAVSSTSPDNLCFVAVVTASSLRTDKLYLPQHFTSSNGITRNCRKAVFLDGGGGWREFCEENGQQAGGFFMFKLVGNGETLVLSFSPTETINDKRQRDFSRASRRESLSAELSSEEENIEDENSDSSDNLSSEEEKIDDENSDSSDNLSSKDECSSMIKTENKKYSRKGGVCKYSSYSPCHKQSITYTFPPDFARVSKLTLPSLFLRENGINKPGEIYLLGKDGVKWPTKLLSDRNGSMRLGKGWRDFVKSNGVETGFTFKLIWEDTTPVLSLCCAESTSDREQEEFPKQSLSTDASNRDKISKVSGMESYSAELSSEEDDTEGEETSEDERSSMMETERKKYSPKQRVKSYSSYSPSHKRLVTFTLPPDYARVCKLTLPSAFLRENGINKPGKIYLSDSVGTKWPTNLNLDKKGTMSLGKGWRDFAKSIGVETGFTLKLMWEDTTPVLSLCCAESTKDREQEEFSKAIKRPSLFMNPTNSDKISKVENNKEEREKNHLRGRTPSSQNQFVTLTIKPYSVAQCRLVLPKKFTRENDITKPGMITLLGSDGIKQKTSLLLDKGNGLMYLGSGWKDFAKANGFNTGDSFTLELIWEDTKPVLRLCPAESSIDRGGEEGEQVNGEPISCEKVIKEERDSTPIVRLFPTESSVSKANESVSTEPNRRDSSSAIQNRFVTLTLTHEDVKVCKLHLPNRFMRDNGINKLGKMTILGENGMELCGYLLSRDGIVALEDGWDEFCEANGVKLGDSFALEFVNEQDNTTPLLKFCSWETNDYKNKC
ncbi:unnamed protein product [Microthlaspi erraticum]|uniref:TF-B3 domain-containing protein n=1 Tax=Microthlaspi erraticum TaxID=1685480 RepID=A0A6D2J1W0_9BRAS|nr:unnamed protein product [Microthlaspi erraticum]